MKVVLGIGLCVGLAFFKGWLFMVIANWALSLFGVAFAFTFRQAFAVCIVLSFVGSFFNRVIEIQK